MEKLEALEKEKMKKYQDYQTMNADFQVALVGFVAEEKLKKEDEKRTKNLCKFEISFWHPTKFVSNSFAQ